MRNGLRGPRPHVASQRDTDEARVALLGQVPVFARLTQEQLFSLAPQMQRVVYGDGENIVTQGDMGDSMFIIKSGGGAVEVQGVGRVLDVEPGASFGEFSLLTKEPRAATVKAAGDTVCLRMTAQDVAPILHGIWGGTEELEDREKLLAKVSIFEELSRGEIRQLATQLERVRIAEQGGFVCRQGDPGDCMYVVEEGSLMVYTR